MTTAQMYFLLKTKQLNYLHNIYSKKRTWQEDPLYPWGQAQSSTSTARSFPVEWGTAMSILMSERLFNPKMFIQNKITSI